MDRVDGVAIGLHIGLRVSDDHQQPTVDCLHSATSGYTIKTNWTE